MSFYNKSTPKSIFLSKSQSISKTPDRKLLSFRPKSQTITFGSPIPSKKNKISFNEVLSIFEKPFKTLALNNDLRMKFSNQCSSLRNFYQQIQEKSGNDKKKLTAEFWEEWTKFEELMHVISQKTSVDYCFNKIISLLTDLDELIQHINAIPPIDPLLYQDHHIAYLQLYQSYVVIRERIFQIYADTIEEQVIIQNLEASRSQLRHFKEEINQSYLPFFRLAQMPKEQQDFTLSQFIRVIRYIIHYFSDLHEQSMIINHLDQKLKDSALQIQNCLSSTFRASTPKKISFFHKKENINDNKINSPHAKILEFPDLDENSSQFNLNSPKVKISAKKTIQKPINQSDSDDLDLIIDAVSNINSTIQNIPLPSQKAPLETLNNNITLSFSKPLIESKSQISNSTKPLKLELTSEVSFEVPEKEIPTTLELEILNNSQSNSLSLSLSKSIHYGNDFCFTTISSNSIANFKIVFIELLLLCVLAYLLN